MSVRHIFDDDKCNCLICCVERRMERRMENRRIDDKSVDIDKIKILESSQQSILERLERLETNIEKNTLNINKLNQLVKELRINEIVSEALNKQSKDKESPFDNVMKLFNDLICSMLWLTVDKEDKDAAGDALCNLLKCSQYFGRLSNKYKR